MKRLPLPWRMTLLAAVAAAVTGLLLGAAILANEVHNEHRALDAFLGEEAGEAFVLYARGLSFNSLATSHSDPDFDFRAAIYDPTGTIKASTENVPPRPPRVEHSRLRTITTSAGESREILIPVPRDTGDLTLAITVSTEVAKSKIRTAAWRIFGTMAGAVLATAIAAFLLTGRALQPIEQVRASGEALLPNPVGRRLAVPGTRDAVARLATTINRVLDAVERGSESQRRFAAHAGHELRTPLARLNAEIELARRPGRTPAELEQAVADIERHAGHLSDLVGSLLDMASAEALPPDLEPVPLTTIVERTVFESGRPELTVKIDDDVAPMAVRCEPHLTVSALRNLVENAYLHGTPPVELSVGRRDDLVEFVVSDHGPGIPPEDWEELTQPFVRGQTEAAGTGLGLAMAAEVARAQGGALTLRPVGAGCAIVLTLSSAIVG